jgi:hypothetical protein
LRLWCEDVGSWNGETSRTFSRIRNGETSTGILWTWDSRLVLTHAHISVVSCEAKAIWSDWLLVLILNRARFYHFHQMSWVAVIVIWIHKETLSIDGLDIYVPPDYAHILTQNVTWQLRVHAMRIAAAMRSYRVRCPPWSWRRECRFGVRFSGMLHSTVGLRQTTPTQVYFTEIKYQQYDFDSNLLRLLILLESYHLN